MQGNDLVFRKSSYSNGSGDCVEVAETADATVAVRDSKNPDGGTHFFGASAWSAFVKVVKAEEFDI